MHAHIFRTMTYTKSKIVKKRSTLIDASDDVVPQTIVCFHTKRLQSVRHSATPEEDELPVSDKMSSEEEDLFLLLVNKYRKKKRTKRRFWVHRYLQNNYGKRLRSCKRIGRM